MEKRSIFQTHSKMDLSTKEAAFHRGVNSLVSLRFPQKLWKIIHENDGGAVQWSKSGSTILINYEQLKDEYLSGAQNTFKTTNISSFVRQLNLYGFRKLSGHLRQLKGDDLSRFRRHNQRSHEYYNAYFLKGRPDLLGKITRKTISDKVSTHRKKNTIQESRQKIHDSRITNCQQALVNALECASGEHEVEEDESDSRSAQDCESEAIKWAETWNNDVWLAANGSSATTAENLLKNINHGLLTSNNFANVIHGNSQTECAWTGNTPPTEFLRKLQYSSTGYEVSCEANILGFTEEKEIRLDDRPTAWQIVENQLLKPIQENKENMGPRVIAQPIEIVSFPYTANFEPNGEMHQQSWGF